VAGPTRLELATSGVTGRRSNQRKYDPASEFVTATPGPGCPPVSTDSARQGFLDKDEKTHEGVCD
jgi:hypothetical protein